MDRTVPAHAALLLDFIGNIEALRGYDSIYGARFAIGCWHTITPGSRGIVLQNAFRSDATTQFHHAENL